MKKAVLVIVILNLALSYSAEACNRLKLGMAGYNKKEINRICSGRATTETIDKKLKFGMIGYSESEIHNMSRAVYLPHRPRTTSTKCSNAYLRLAEEAADFYSIPREYVKAIMKAESGCNSSAISPKGAIGLMQLMPNTARKLGVYNSFNPRDNVFGGAKYLRQQLDTFGNYYDATRAYIAGPKAVLENWSVVSSYEVISYTNRVLKLKYKFSTERLAKN